MNNDNGKIKHMGEQAPLTSNPSQENSSSQSGNGNNNSDGNINLPNNNPLKPEETQKSIRPIRK